ncbi:MAG TPA: S8 family serine peptidase [Vicinamibacterales bacterium]
MTRLAPLVVAWLVIGLDATALAQRPRDDHKLDDYLRRQAASSDDGDGVERVIVTFKAGTSAPATERLRRKGAAFSRTLPTIGAVALRVPRGQLRAVAEDSEVLHVSHDSPVVAQDIEATSVSGTALQSAYSLRRTLGIDGVGSASPLVGRGVTVAVIDSGIHPGRDFQGRIAAFVDFTGEDIRRVTDPYGHGTHVAGTIGGHSRQVSGVAPGVTFIGLRVLDSKGVGTTSRVIRALQWAIDHRRSHAIDIVNLSLGHPVFEPAATDPLVQAVEAAVRAGLIVVVSAGNRGSNPETGLVGYAGVSSPGNAPSAITVGAIRTYGTTRRTDDLVAEYSSRGPSWYDAFAKPDVVAPGHRVLATSSDTTALYQAFPVLRGRSGDLGRQYLYLSGTSMATAVTTGTVALAVEAGRRAFGVKPTPRQMKAMLMQTAFPMVDASGTPYDVLTQGAGALNGGGLVALGASLAPRTQWTPARLVDGVDPWTVVDGEALAWGQNIVWSDSLLGIDALDAHRAAQVGGTMWWTRVVWGDNIVWSDSDNIVWSDSDNIVWSDSDNIVWSDAAILSLD